MSLGAFLEGGRRNSTPGTAEPVGVSPPEAVDSIGLSSGALARARGVPTRPRPGPPSRHRSTRAGRSAGLCTGDGPPAPGERAAPPRGGGGVGAVESQPANQHLVLGAAERDGLAPQRAEGPQDVQVLEGVTGARGDDLSENGHRPWRRDSPTTSGRCVNGSRCQPFNAAKTPPDFLVRFRAAIANGKARMHGGPMKSRRQG